MSNSQRVAPIRKKMSGTVQRKIILRIINELEIVLRRGAHLPNADLVEMGKNHLVRAITLDAPVQRTRGES